MTPTGNFFKLPQSSLPYISIEKPTLVCNITYKTYNKHTTTTLQNQHFVYFFNVKADVDVDVDVEELGVQANAFMPASQIQN